jgi:hypothetical protein
MHIAKNAEPAAWITSRLHRFGQDVGWVIPEGFEAYARVFHPPYRLTPSGTQIPVRWGDIAAANNRTIAAEMQRLDLSAEPSRFSRSGEELWTEQPRCGNLPWEIAERLAAILPSFTRTPESCWFGVWEGFGDLGVREWGAPMFSVPQRNLFLLHGTVADVLTTLSDIDWYRSPNLWWPDDRAWCVATEIDFNWSYVGGTLDCIQQILSDAELEALPTDPTQGNWMQDELQSPTRVP